ALDDVHINQYLANDSQQRRSSHRSRVALSSQIRSYRAAFPNAFRSPRAKNAGERTPELSEAWQFDIALAPCGTLPNPATRTHPPAVLLLCRGAGLDGRELRHVTGDHVAQRPNAGTWVTVTRAGHDRAVPILARWADAIEELAVFRGPG